MSATIYDLAKHAGVSIATVSRVFSGRGHVAERTRARVFAAAEELGYEPNVSARSLARKSTLLVSVVVPMLASYFFMEVIRGIQDRLGRSGYDLLVFAAHSLERIDGQLERALQRGRADGLILCSTPMTPARVAGLADARNPVVLADAYHATLDSVSVNNREGGYAATKHLLAQGYQRVAHIAPIAVSLPGAARRAGYEDALRDAGRDLEPRYVVTADAEAERHGYTIEAGYEAMRALLALPRRPDAVFAASDMQALGALRAIREAGLRTPGDVALIGFDDVQTSAYAGLSTLRQPMYEMGRVAADKLLQRIERPSRPVSHTSFSAQLIVRETCGAQRAAGPASPDEGISAHRATVPIPVS